MAFSSTSAPIPLLHQNDLIHLQPGSRLTDTIINPYINLLGQRTTIATWKVLALDSFFHSCLALKRDEIAARRFKDVNPFDYQLLLIPLFIEDLKHWALIAVFPDRKRIHVYDSLGLPHKQELYNVFYALKREARRRDIEMATDAWHLQNTTSDCPRQDNNIDCGVFVLWFAERLARGEEVHRTLHGFDPDCWRRHILEVLRKGSIEIEDGFLAERGIVRPAPVSPITAEKSTNTEVPTSKTTSQVTPTPSSTLDMMLNWVPTRQEMIAPPSEEETDDDWLMQELGKLDNPTRSSTPCLDIAVEPGLLDEDFEGETIGDDLKTTDAPSTSSPGTPTPTPKRNPLKRWRRPKAPKAARRSNSF